MPFAGGGTWLAQHQHRWDLGACTAWDTCLAHQQALLRADASTSIGSCLVCLGLAQHLHRWGLGAPRCTTSASAHACTSRGTCLVDHQHQRDLGARESLDQHRLMPCDDRGTWLAQHWNQRGRGAPRCLEQSRIMLVLPGAPVWHPIGTNGALLRADALTSIGLYLVSGEPG